MNCPPLRSTLWSAAIIVFTTGCTEKNRMAPTTTKSNTPMAASTDNPTNPVPITTYSRYAGQIIHGGPASGVEPAGRVIRDQAEYAALVATLPKYRVQMKQPAPPSEDPLLKRPPIDFSRHMLVVAIRRSMFYRPKIRRVLLAHGKELIVEILHESPAGIMAMASRSDVGTYEAVIVPRADEKPVFLVEKKTVKPAGK